jgi:hypothetical protein
MEREEIDYPALQKDYGTMYHLILDSLDKGGSIRYASVVQYPKYATINGHPVFYLPLDKQFFIALDYTIVYPKIYVRKYMEVESLNGLKRSYLH